MTARMAGPPSAEPGLSPWAVGPTCPDCHGTPLVPSHDLNRPESAAGLPLGCPACGEGCDGTPEQIEAVMAAHRAWCAEAAERSAAEDRALLAGSPAGRAVAALFELVPGEGGRVRLRVPSLASGGWVCVVEPLGQPREIGALRDQLVAAILIAQKPALSAIFDRARRGFSEQVDPAPAIERLTRELAAVTAERDALRRGAAPAVPRQIPLFEEPAGSRAPLTLAALAIQAELDASETYRGPLGGSVALPPLPQRFGVAVRNCKTCGKPGHNRRTCKKADGAKVAEEA